MRLMKPRILFMGTPDFAAGILRALFEKTDMWDIAGVFSQPDKPKGRGHRVVPTPVKLAAQEEGIPVYQPQSLRSEEASKLLHRISPDVIVVAAYGKILPEEFLYSPPHGCVNIHGSLLPEYRGAAPVQRAVIDGRRQTGVTIMRMAEGLDTGDMLGRRTVDILPEDDAGSLFQKIEACGAALLLETLPLYLEGRIAPEPQDDKAATYAAKLEKADCRLDFSGSARDLHNLVRGLSPAPLAFSALKRQTDGEASETVVKFAKTEIAVESGCCGEPGTVLSVSPAVPGIDIACGSGVLRLVSLVPSGKGKMSAADFARGRGISAGDRFL